ncbi:MAG: TonB-dependent receptor, partial [Gammaproteobacteria bacterium]|nr:TonB-dependent receptor [Gammaproteobacteria bacterium]
LQPKLSVNWTVTDETSVFASWGKGFRSGGFNSQGSEATVDTFINNLLFDEFGNNGLCDPSVPGCLETSRSQINITDDYRKETSTAIELGFKSSLLDGGLRLEGAIYQTDVDDMQFFEFIVGPFGLLRVVENIDDVQLRGLELAATWDATEWLDLYIGANFNDTEIKKNSARPDTVGNDSPYTPDYTGTAGAYLNLPVNDEMEFFANLNISAVGKTWFHAVQDQSRPIGFELVPAVGGPFTPGNYTKTRRDAYELLNLRTGVETDTWTAAIWVDNLTDEDYLEEVIPAPEFGGSFGHPGGLRRIGAEFLYRF